MKANFYTCFSKTLIDLRCKNLSFCSATIFASFQVVHWRNMLLIIYPMKSVAYWFIFMLGQPAGSVMQVCKVAKFFRDDVGHFLCLLTWLVSWLAQTTKTTSYLVVGMSANFRKVDVWIVSLLYCWQVLLDKKCTRYPRRCSQFWAISWVRVERGRPLWFSCSFLCVSSMILPFFLFLCTVSYKTTTS